MPVKPHSQKFFKMVTIVEIWVGIIIHQVIPDACSFLLVIFLRSGLIGRSWAMLFASAGYKVIMYDVEPAQISSALENILSQLKELEKSGLLRGSLSAVEQHKLISGTNSFAECVVDAKYVQVSYQFKASLSSLIYFYEIIWELWMFLN